MCQNGNFYETAHENALIQQLLPFRGPTLGPTNKLNKPKGRKKQPK